MSPSPPSLYRGRLGANEHIKEFLDFSISLFWVVCLYACLEDCLYYLVEGFMSSLLLSFLDSSVLFFSVLFRLPNYAQHVHTRST